MNYKIISENTDDHSVNLFLLFIHVLCLVWNAWIIPLTLWERLTSNGQWLTMWMHKSALFPIAGTFILAECSAFCGVRHSAARTWFSITLAVTNLSLVITSCKIPLQTTAILSSLCSFECFKLCASREKTTHTHTHTHSQVDADTSKDIKDKTALHQYSFALPICKQWTE